MKIKQISSNTQHFSSFMLEEWKRIHEEHYGEKLELSYWHTQHIYLEAREGSALIGALIGEYFGGVFFIPEVIVSHEHRGKGVGKALLDHVEEWTRNHHGHEVCLMTGKHWKEKGFYLKCGYHVAGDLPRHYSKTDFVFMRKFVDSKK